MDAETLAEVAQDLVIRVRDDTPEANASWLTSTLTDPADWFRLCFVLAAAVPDDKPWRHLTAWALTTPVDLPAQSKPRRVLHPCGTWPAAKRHRYYKEPLCDACREAERVRNLEASRKRSAQRRGEVAA
jgi:hypothetical protein